MAGDVADVLDRAGAVLAELRDVDLDGLADDTLSEAVLAVQHLRGSLEVAEAQVLSRWDAQGCWHSSGARTGAAWLSWKQRVPIGVARQRLRHARALRTLPSVEGAWAAGEIDRAHVTTLLGARTARTEAAFYKGHHTLLELARTTGFSRFKRACDHWTMVVDPRRCRAGCRRRPCRPRTAPLSELRRHVVRAHDVGPRVRGDRRHHPAPDRTGAVRC